MIFITPLSFLLFVTSHIRVALREKKDSESLSEVSELCMTKEV